tara:strand:+ start:18526 stop:18960 length:435 start_codon:yes stop_codon:yes gene_type:complete
MESLIEILQDQSLVSLRMIDWFVTKHSKANGLQYDVRGKPFNVYANYKSQLKAYSKRQLDPFCRRDRVVLQKHNSKIVTTIGQMNFFRWAIENLVLKYIYDNYDNLIKDMKKENKKGNSRKKITNNHNKRSFTKSNISMTLTFD